MKRFALLSVLASLAFVVGGCVSDQSVDTTNSRIRIRSFIDGSDVIKVRGDQVWYVHKAYELPGKWQGCDEATLVNGEKWFPVWDGTLSDHYTIEDKDHALPPNTAFTKDTLEITAKAALGDFYVSEYPNEENNYTLSITVDDRAAEGASWYEFGIDWDDETK